MDASALTNLSSSQREELMDQVKQQIAIANTQELITVSCSKHWDYVIQRQFRL